MQVVEGLAFMHEQAMIHCDIKEPNMMVKLPNYSAPQIVIIDFGISKAMASSDGPCLKGTPGYLPPETYDSGFWYPRGDVFSAGVAIFQLLTDKLPPEGPRTLQTPGGIFIEGCGAMQDIQQATKTRQPPYHLLPSDTGGLNRLLPGMLAKRMQDRPTAVQLLKDPWFTQSDSMCPREKVKGKNTRATQGITKSFLASLDKVEDSSTISDPSLAAIHKIRKMHSIKSTVEEGDEEQEDTDDDDDDSVASDAPQAAPHAAPHAAPQAARVLLAPKPMPGSVGIPSADMLYNAAG